MLRKFLKSLGGTQPSGSDDAMGEIAIAPKPERDSEIGEAADKLRRFLVRQQLLDAAHQVVGYELKLWNRDPTQAGGPDDQSVQLQDEMLLVSVIDLDYQEALGNQLTFISLSPATLDNPLLQRLPRDKVVISLRLPADADEHLLERCRELAEQGFQFAFDDLDRQHGLEPFLKICRYAGIDTRGIDALTLSDRVAKILDAGVPALIAKNIESEEAFEAYRRLAFSVFQGHYFTRTQTDGTRRIDSSRLRVMELLNMVKCRAELSELEAKVKLDPGLVYKLLRYINSPANGFRQSIQSINNALMLIGYDQLYRWLTLLLFTSGEPDARRQALLKNALVRARFAETLGQGKLDPADQSGLFIVGIFSLLDVLLNVPMIQAIAGLSLPKPFVDVLLHQEGIYAPYLKLAIACEGFDQEAIAGLAAACGLTAYEVNLAHVKALIWAEVFDA